MNPHFKDTYIPPTLTVDSVIFQLIGGELNVLLIQRRHDPFQGLYALPGGYCSAGETTRQAMERVAKAKAGVTGDDFNLIEQLYTFDTVARDPRGHAVSVTYMVLGLDIQPDDSGDAQNPAFYPVNKLPELAYDHRDIIELAVERLRSKLGYTNAIFALLPERFTLSELQAGYEAVFGRLLDKRNFRKKFLSLDLIVPTGELRQDGAHRPARLYQFKDKGLRSLTRSFD